MRYLLKLTIILLSFIGFAMIVANAFTDRVENVKAWSTADKPVYISTIGGHTGNGQLSRPYHSSIYNDKVYVIEDANSRVQYFSLTGEYIGKFGSRGTADGQFTTPYGIGVHDNKIFVVDSGNSRIQVFDLTGNFLYKFGNQGSGDGQFNFPTGIWIDQNDNVFVTDTYNNRVQKFDIQGNFILKFGTSGTGDGQMRNPTGITTDVDGNIYITELLNHRIQIFDSSGSYLSKFGSNGSGNGQFIRPWDISITSDQKLVVADEQNYRIQIFDIAGNYLSQFGSRGAEIGQLFNPLSATLDSQDNIYVTEWISNRVQVFDLAGNSLFTFGSEILSPTSLSGTYGVDIYQDYIIIPDYHNNRVVIYNKAGVLVKTIAPGTGSGVGMLNLPRKAVADSNGKLFVIDVTYSRIQVFDIASGNYLYTFGSNGTGDGQFTGLSGIDIGENGDVFTVDSSRRVVQVFDNSGVFKYKFGSSGSGDGFFNFPWDLKVDNNKIYVADSFNHRIQIFDLNGNFITKFGSIGTDNGKFNLPISVEIDTDGNIYVVEGANNRIQKFDQSLNHIYTFGSVGHDSYQFNIPAGVDTDETGRLYVAEVSNARVQVYSYDRLAPTGSIVINSQASHTNSTGVTLSLTAVDSISSIKQMLVSEDSNFLNATWEPFSVTKSYTISQGDGLKTIYVKYEDDYTNISQPYSASIILDTISPSIIINKIGLITNVPDRKDLTYYFTSTTPKIEGVTDSLSTVSFTVNSKTYTTVADSNGKFVVILNNPQLTKGENLITYKATDKAGNTSESRTLKLIIGQEYFPEWLIPQPDNSSIIDEDEQDEVDEPETPEKPTLPETPSTTVYRIQFKDSNGTPLTNTVVQINGANYITDKDGFISLTESANTKLTYRVNGVLGELEVSTLQENYVVVIADEKPTPTEKPILAESKTNVWIWIGISVIAFIMIAGAGIYAYKKAED